MHTNDSNTLEAKVAFLRQAAHYPEHSSRVEAIETHMSWVFLLEHRAYKLKKPVCLDSFDCRTLARRARLCRAELRLNRRLAPEVYLDLVALTRDEKGHLSLGGQGRAVDWLVRMKRLPADQMLDHAILNHTLAPDDLDRLALRLASFHASLPPALTDPAVYSRRLEHKIEDERRQLVAAASGVFAEHAEPLCTQQSMALESLQSLLAGRVLAGKIVDGHGDLRPEHVCLRPEIAIIDCLEFSRELRTQDTMDEVGFLALECERLGNPDAGAWLLSRYREASHDDIAGQPLNFYQSCRARTRALIAARHLRDAPHRDLPHWRQKTEAYLALARQHLARCR